MLGGSVADFLFGGSKKVGELLSDGRDRVVRGSGGSDGSHFGAGREEIEGDCGSVVVVVVRKGGRYRAKKREGGKAEKNAVQSDEGKNKREHAFLDLRTRSDPLFILGC